MGVHTGRAAVRHRACGMQCRIKGGARGAAALGPAVSGGPQLMGVVSWL